MPGPERQTRCSAFSFMPSTELWRPVLWGQVGAPGPPEDRRPREGARCGRCTHVGSSPHITTLGCSIFSNLLNLSVPQFPSVKRG